MAIILWWVPLIIHWRQNLIYRRRIQTNKFINNKISIKLQTICHNSIALHCTKTLRGIVFVISLQSQNMLTMLFLFCLNDLELLEIHHHLDLKMIFSYLMTSNFGYRCNALQRVATCFQTLRHVATRYNMLQR